MINFRCYLIDVCVRLRQFNILSRGLGSKEILSSEWMQSNKFSDSVVKLKTCDGSLNRPSEAVHKPHFQKSNPSTSSSVLIIGNGSETKRQRCPKSCSRHNIFHCSTVFNSRPSLCRTNQQRFFSTSKVNKFLNVESWGIMKNNNEFAQNAMPYPFSMLLIPRNELKALEIRLTIDPEFRTKSFLEGAKTALVYVSGALADGRFDDLKGLVEDEARSIIELNCKNMSEQKRRLLAVDENLTFYPALGHIKIIRGEKGSVTLEAPVVAFYTSEALPNKQLNYTEFAEYFKFCVYIFRKNVDKTDGGGSWMIHKLEYMAMKPSQSNQ